MNENTKYQPHGQTIDGKRYCECGRRLKRQQRLCPYCRILHRRKILREYMRRYRANLKAQAQETQRQATIAQARAQAEAEAREKARHITPVIIGMTSYDQARACVLFDRLRRAEQSRGPDLFGRNQFYR